MMYYAHHADFSSKRKKRLIVLFNSEIYAIKAHTSFAQYLDFAVNRITARETVDLFSILIFHIKKKFINIYAIYVYIYIYICDVFFFLMWWPWLPSPRFSVNFGFSNESPTNRRLSGKHVWLTALNFDKLF